MRSKTPFPLLLVLATLLLGTAQAQVRYVKSGAEGGGNSWEDAMGDVQAAMDSLAGPGGEVWIAAGTYKPDISGFLLPPNVCLYGGFPADATDATTFLDRDPKAHRTILSGDLGDDDEFDDDTGLPLPETMTDNAWRVLDIQELGSGQTIVDGFVIEGGNTANEPGSGTMPHRGGGGIRVLPGGGGGYRNSGSLILRNCEVRRNRAGHDEYQGTHGGGLFAESVNLHVIDCLFSRNVAGDGRDGEEGLGGQQGEFGMVGGGGGGIAVRYGADAVFDRVLFKNNRAGYGGHGGKGGDNPAGDAGDGGNGGPGGAGGGLLLQYIGNQAVLRDCLFVANWAGRGGAGGAGGDTPAAGARAGAGGDGAGSDPASYGFSGCGGAVFFEYCHGEATVQRSTFAENRAGDGGAGGAGGIATGDGEDGQPGVVGPGGDGGAILFFEGSPVLENSTFFANYAAAHGGGLAFAVMYNAYLTGQHLTFADNHAAKHGGAVSMVSRSPQEDGATLIANSVFSGNRISEGGIRAPDDDVWASHQGMTIAHSLLAEPVPGGVIRDQCLAADPRLKPLAWNGGRTPTMALAADSPATNSDIFGSAYASVGDQRGFPRDAAPDLGAFESRVQASDLTVANLTATSASLAWTAGDWPHSVVFLRPEDPEDPRPRPEDGIAYATGGKIANTPWLCVYAGSETTVNLADLAPDTTYRIMVCSTEGELYLHNTEDAADNPLVFSTPPSVVAPVLVSPVHCPADDPAHGHSLEPEPVLVWDPPANPATAHFQVWLDGVKIGDTTLDTAGFRYFDGMGWAEFPDTGGMPATAQRIAFRRVAGEIQTRRETISEMAREWWVEVTDGAASATSAQHRFLVKEPAWEDGDAVAGFTLIRKAQIEQLRAEANALRRMRGLADVSFAETDDVIVVNETPIRGVHFQKIRQAVADAAAETGADPALWEWTDPVLQPNETPVRAVHLNELRAALEGRYPVDAQR